MPRRPYRRPREWLPADDYGDFGVTKTVRIDPPKRRIPREEALVRAALRQHHLARTIRDKARAEGVTLTDLAEYADLHPNTVREVLNGASHANLATLAVLARALDLDVVIATRPFEHDPTTLTD